MQTPQINPIWIPKDIFEESDYEKAYKMFGYTKTQIDEMDIMKTEALYQQMKEEV